MTSRSTQTRTRHWWALDPAGSLVGLAFAVLSITPSLLPRPAVLQGALAGISFAVGYLLGAVVWALVRRLLWRGGTVPPFRPVSSPSQSSSTIRHPRTPKTEVPQ